MARPVLSASLAEDEFRRWYWTMAELQPFARSVGLRAAGPKAALIERIAAQLGGREQPVEPSSPGPAAAPIAGDLSLTTELPAGQRATQALRDFFEREIGATFRFNGHMRAFLKGGGVTLGDAVRHWYETQGEPLPTQSKSLEFNAFTKAWHAVQVDGTAADCRQAWERYRALPVDKRPSIADA